MCDFHRGIISEEACQEILKERSLALEYVTLNKKIYEIVKEECGHGDLVHTRGFSDEHTQSTMYCDLFSKPVTNLGFRVFVVVKPGKFFVLTHFHKFYKFAREIFHPRRGLMFRNASYRFPKEYIGTHTLPKDFDGRYLPILKKYGVMYSRFLENPLIEGIPTSLKKFFVNIRNRQVSVPEYATSANLLEIMDWEEVVTSPGDVISCDVRSVFFFGKTKKKHTGVYVPYIVSSISLFKGVWYGSPEHKKCVREFTRTEGTKKITNINLFRKKITGQTQYEKVLDVDETFTKILGTMIDVVKSKNSLTFFDEWWSYTPNFFDDDLSQKIFEGLLPSFEKLCMSYTVSMYGKSFESRKISCIFTENPKEISERADAKSKGFDYAETPAYAWSEAPVELTKIKELLEEEYKFNLDYVLCHIYRGITQRKKLDGTTITRAGQDYIGFHNDKEALNSEIISVSFGATRKFEIREMKNKRNSDCIYLKSGDVFHMYGPRGENQRSCQHIYEHQVPPMTLKELKEFVLSKDIKMPKGRVTFDSLTEICNQNSIEPTRINLTFRQFE